MTAEKPMKKIMLVHETDDSIMFRSECDCGDSEHDMVIDIYFDKKNGIATITHYKTLSIDSYIWYDADQPFLERVKSRLKIFWKRIKVSAEVTFTGWAKLDSDFVFVDKDHLDDFIKTLEYGKERIKMWDSNLKGKV